MQERIMTKYVPLKITSHRVLREGEYVHIWQIGKRGRFILNGKEWRVVSLYPTKAFARQTKGKRLLRKFSPSDVVKVVSVTKLRARWMCDLKQDLKCLYHVDVQRKLVKSISKELTSEIENDTRKKIALALGGY